MIRRKSGLLNAFPLIAEIHGGRIRIESGGRGRGTTVCLTPPGASPSSSLASA